MRPHLTRMASVVGAVCAFILAGCGKNAPSQPQQPPAPVDERPPTAPTRTPPKEPVSEPKQPTPEEIRNGKPDITLSAKDFKEQYDKNPGDFVDRARGKVVEITGTVDGFDYSGSGSSGWLFLAPGGVKVGCFDAHPMSLALPGQKVTLRTTWKQNIGFDNWFIIRAEGDPPPTVAADDLAKQFQADAEGTKKKYKGKYLIVTGSVRKVEKATGTTIRLTTGGGEGDVTCYFGVSASEVAERNGWFKEGARVRVLGMWLGGGPQLDGCYILP
jgi:hypothetical protein